MSIIINVDNDRQLTTHTVIGEVTVEELLTALKQFWETRPTMNELWDFRDASEAHVVYEEVDDIFDLIRSYAEKRSGGKTAFVSSGDMEHGMPKMIQAILVDENSPFQVEVFPSVEKALNWIGEKE